MIDWLAQTPLSLAIQTRSWVIPTIQSIHIAAIGVVVTSVLMIDLRVLGYAGQDQTVTDTVRRYGPWLSWSLVVALVTGILMVIGEPARELLAFSFWFKMVLVAVGSTIAVAFRVALTRDARTWESSSPGPATKSLAVLTLVIWAAIIFLGRLIAYDHIWGSWSHSTKA